MLMCHLNSVATSVATLLGTAVYIALAKPALITSWP
jgi:hypothetical protein